MALGGGTGKGACSSGFYWLRPMTGEPSMHQLEAAFSGRRRLVGLCMEFRSGVMPVDAFRTWYAFWCSCPVLG